MTEVKHTEIFNCRAEQFFSVLVDYESYPKFLQEVRSCKIIENKGKNKKVEYHLSLIKDFHYVNSHTEIDSKEVSWTFLRGDLFKEMNGYWKLKEKGGKTEVEYFVQADFGLFVPGFITKTLLSVNLPNTMKSYHKRLKELYT